MINFKINLDSGLITLEKPSGKSLSLQAGEIVKADVLDVLSSGDVTLRIKGMIVTAKTEVQLQKDATAYFKVTNMPDSANGLKLQFAGYTEAGAGETAAPNFASTPQGEVVSKLLGELSAGILKDPGNIDPKAIENLLKSLPSDMNVLPKDMRAQLQELLQTSLKSAGQGIQTRLDNLFKLQLPDELRELPVVKSITQDLLVNVEKLLQTPLKNVLQDTGVALEAKLRTIASILEQMDIANADASKPPAQALQQIEDYTGVLKSADPDNDLVPLTVTKDGVFARETGDSTGPGRAAAEEGPVAAAASRADTDAAKIASPEPQKTSEDDGASKTPEADKGDAGQRGGRESLPAAAKEGLQRQAQVHMPGAGDDVVFNKDLKAGLLQLKELLSNEGKEASRTIQGHGFTPDQRENAIRTVDGLLKNIETLQLLSKTTDSFYTFLPISWNELKDGEVSFKKGGRDAKGGESYSCRINLDLEKQGKLTVTVLKYNSEFFVSFRAENPTFQSFLKSNAEELKDTFRDKGMHLKAVSLRDADDDSPDQLERLETGDKIISIKA